MKSVTKKRAAQKPAELRKLYQTKTKSLFLQFKKTFEMLGDSSQLRNA